MICNSRAIVLGVVASMTLMSQTRAGVTIQDSQDAFGHARFIGNTFGFGSGPSGGPTSINTTQANSIITGGGGSGSTGGGLGNNPGTVQYGSATTTVTVTATAGEFRIHVSGVGDMNAPSGYTNLTIESSLSFFETALAITGSGQIPYTIQKTGDLAGVSWTIVPESGTGASLGAGTLTAGSYLFDDNGTPTTNVVYSFGSGGTGNQHRTFSGDFVVTVGAVATGVCCRGATCNTSITQANCLPTGAAGASFAASSSTCNAASNSTAPCCYADYTKSGGIAVSDIFAYLQDWFAASPAAVIGGNGSSGSPRVNDIFNFIAAWFAGGC